MATSKEVRTIREGIKRRGRVSTVLMLAGGVPLLVGLDQGLPALLAFAVFLVGWIYVYTSKCLSCGKMLGMFAVGEAAISFRPNPPPQVCPHCHVNIDRRLS